MSPQAVAYTGTHSDGGPGEWMTPPWLLEVVRNILGGIELDPMSSDAAQENVRAERYWTVADDCFAQDSWRAETLWLNPPFGRGILNRAVSRFIVEQTLGNIGRAMVITNNVTETMAGQALLACADAVWFPKTRVQFIDELTGKPVKGNPRGQMICAFGVHMPQITVPSGVVLR